MTFALSCLSLSGLADNTIPEKSFFSFRAGPSVPKGDFASKDANKRAAGFANSGFHVAAEYGGFFNRYFGGALTAGISRNGFDHSAYNSQTRARLYASSGWRSTYFLGNLLAGLPLGQHFSVYLKGGAGFTLNTYPDVQTNGGGIGSGSTVNEQKIKSESLAYGFGGGFKWHVNGVGIGLEANYLGTKPTFSYASTSYKQPMNALSYNFNLSFKLK